MRFSHRISEGCFTDFAYVVLRFTSSRQNLLLIMAQDGVCFFYAVKKALVRGDLIKYVLAGIGYFACTLGLWDYSLQAIHGA